MNNKLLLNAIYPIGSIYLSVNSTNPSTIFGGTWERIAKGRTLVGVDENDNDFTPVKKTGGSKYLQSHTHSYDIALNGTIGSDGRRFIMWNETGSTYNGAAGAVNNAGTGNSGNLQPYYTCYIFVRTA